MIRQPRPVGTTQLAHSLLNQITITQNKRKLLIQEHIIRDYVLQGYTHNKDNMSIDTLAYSIGIDKKKAKRLLIVGLRSQSKALGSTQDEINEYTRAMIFGLFKRALNDRARVEAQTDLLTASQGTAYKPFISSTVNQSLKLLLESQKPILDILALMTPKNTGTQLTINNQNNLALSGPQGDKYLTTESAVNLLAETQGNSGLPALEEKSQIYLNHGLEGMPDISAQEVNRSQGDHFEANGPEKAPENSMDRHLDRRLDTHDIEDIDPVQEE